MTGSKSMEEKLRYRLERLFGRIQGKPRVSGEYGEIVQYTYYSPYSPQELSDQAMKLFDQELKKHVEEARKTVKRESAHDFDGIVKAYNLAIENKFDTVSVTRLYFAINSADCRAKYIDLPEQSTITTQPPKAQS